jgi:hypothetical protein
MVATFTDTAAPEIGDMTAVIYIAGLPRSGSTLVGRLLADRYDVQFCGELLHLAAVCPPVADEFCGCGRKLATCEFWRPVSVALQDRNAASVRSAMKDAMERNLASMDSSLVDALRTTLEAIWAANCAPIVDSSKVPRFASYIQRAFPSCEIHVLHLVRDPSAVIASVSTRPLKRPEVIGQQSLKTFPPGSVADRWRRHNAQAAQLRYSASSYHLVRLEDLVSAPTEAMKPIALAAGLRLRQSTDAVDHSLRGNPSRFETLHVDPERCRRVGAPPRLWFHRLRAMLGSAYGYPRIER